MMTDVSSFLPVVKNQMRDYRHKMGFGYLSFILVKGLSLQTAAIIMFILFFFLMLVVNSETVESSLPAIEQFAAAWRFQKFTHIPLQFNLQVQEEGSQKDH